MTWVKLFQEEVVLNMSGVKIPQDRIVLNMKGKITPRESCTQYEWIKLLQDKSYSI